MMLKNLPRPVILDKRLEAYPAPLYLDQGVSGYELRAMIDVPLALFPGQTEMLPLGFALEDSLPLHVCAFHVPFSGETARTALMLGDIYGLHHGRLQGRVRAISGELGATGVTGDAAATDFRCLHVMASVHPVAKAPIVISPGQRLGRIVLMVVGPQPERMPGAVVPAGDNVGAGCASRAHAPAGLDVPQAARAA